MIRVVIDTNILVSALLKPESLPATVLMLTLAGRIQLCISELVYDEYVEVVRRPHFKRDPEVIGKSLLAIRKLAHWVKPTEVVEVCNDPDDNIFLECSQAAGADYLVTGNRRHFPVRWNKTKIIGARELIELLMEQEK